jgi:hypothetical protein
MSRKELGLFAQVIAYSASVTAIASTDSVGPDGINSANLPLTGLGISIGQLELRRSGDPDIDDDGTHFEVNVDDDGSHSNFGTDPKAVFVEDGIIAVVPSSDLQLLDPPPVIHHAT